VNAGISPERTMAEARVRTIPMIRAGVPAVFHRAREGDSFLRLAEEFRLLAQLVHRTLSAGDSTRPDVIDTSLDEHFVRALDRA